MSQPIMCVHRTSVLPKQYDNISREMMEKAGVVEIVKLFEHSRDFKQFGFKGTEYHFENGRLITDSEKFRSIVYGNERRK